MSSVRDKSAACVAVAVLIGGSIASSPGFVAQEESEGEAMVVTEPLHTPVSRSVRLSPKLFALQRLRDLDYGSDAYRCLVRLWNRESRWNPYAHNKRTGAYGIPQRIDGYGKPSMDDYRGQIVWGINYVIDRYGTPCAALQHQLRKGWY